MGRIPPQTESYVAYHRAREERIRTIQTSRAAYWMLERLVDGPTGDGLLGQFVDASRAERPEAKRVTNAAAVVLSARSTSARMGIVHELSAFERFLRAALVEASQFCDDVRAQEAFTHDHEPLETSLKRCSGCQDVAWRFVNEHPLTDRSSTLTTSLGVSIVPDDALLPLLNYFWHARNRIAHEDSFCGERLAEFSRSAELDAAVSTWNSKYSKRAAPPLPKSGPDERLVFRHEHAILCGAVCSRIARALTTGIVGKLGERGMLLMAAYYAYFGPEHPHRARNHRQPDQAITNFLHLRYRYKLASKGAVVAVLRKHGLWDLARAGFREMYLAKGS
jgi:hypothetical protein